MGHYLGLYHTASSWYDPCVDYSNPLDRAGCRTHIESLLNSGGVAAFDGDGMSDTPPDPGVIYYHEGRGWPTCGGPDGFSVNGSEFVPPFTNIMSYFGGHRCQPPYIIT